MDTSVISRNTIAIFQQLLSRMFATGGATQTGAQVLSTLQAAMQNLAASQQAQSVFSGTQAQTTAAPMDVTVRYVAPENADKMMEAAAKAQEIREQYSAASDAEKPAIAKQLTDLQNSYAPYFNASANVKVQLPQDAPERPRIFALSQEFKGLQKERECLVSERSEWLQNNHGNPTAEADWPGYQRYTEVCRQMFTVGNEAYQLAAKYKTE